MSFHGPWRIASNPSTDWLTPIVRTGRCDPSKRLRRLTLSSALLSGSRVAHDFSERRDEVGLLHKLVAAASRRDHARPADHERHAMPAFPDITLIAAKWSAGKMPLALEFSNADVRAHPLSLVKTISVFCSAWLLSTAARTCPTTASVSMTKSA